MLAIKLGHQTWRRREAQPRSPRARVNHRKTQRFVPPRVIQIKCRARPTKNQCVRLSKKLNVACFGDAQIFLGLL